MKEGGRAPESVLQTGPLYHCTPWVTKKHTALFLGKFIAESVRLKQFWKSVNIYQSYAS